MTRAPAASGETTRTPVRPVPGCSSTGHDPCGLQAKAARATRAHGVKGAGVKVQEKATGEGGSGCVLRGGHGEKLIRLSHIPGRW